MSTAAPGVDHQDMTRIAWLSLNFAEAHLLPPRIRTRPGSRSGVACAVDDTLGVPAGSDR